LFGIFVSYRRADSEGYAGRLSDSLLPAFGSEEVFIDVDAINPGVDFVKRIRDAVTQSNVVLVLIGTHWLSVTDRSGHRRLDNPDDHVRVEVREALERETIRVIPLLVGGAELPTADELPEDLAPLARRNGLRLSHADWRTDCDRLLQELRSLLEARDRPKHRMAIGKTDQTRLVDVAAGGQRELLVVPGVGSAHDVALSFDGRRLATSGRTGTVWAIDERRELRRVNHKRWVSRVDRVALSGDGKRLATYSSRDKTTRVWAIDDGRELRSMKHADAQMLPSLALSHDGKRLATAHYGERTARVCDVESGGEHKAVHAGSVNSVAFNFDGTCLATASDDMTARLWALPHDGEWLRELRRRTHEDSVRRVTFSPVRRRFGTASVDMVRLWALDDGRELLRLPLDGSDAIVFSSDGKCFATAALTIARVWSHDDGRELLRVTHEDRIAAIGFTSHGEHLVTATTREAARVWTFPLTQE